MSNIGNLLNEAGTQMRKQQDATKHLTNKWNKTGLLEGIAHEYDKTGMAVLLENQARQLIDENSSTGTTTSSEQWSGVALPLVRRIFSEIAAKDFVSVQQKESTMVIDLPKVPIYSETHLHQATQLVVFTVQEDMDIQSKINLQQEQV